MECRGRDCTLGCGYNESLDLLIPVEGDLPNVKRTNRNQWGHRIWSLTSTIIYYWVSIFFVH